MKTSEVIIARGHENIRSTNKTTFEITKDDYLTKRGDCIVAVDATKGASDLSQISKKILCNEKAQVTINIEVDGENEIVKALGSPELTLTHSTDLVVRKSSFICDRTLAIKADKAAYDFSRSLVEKLKNSKQKVKITLTFEKVI